MNFFTSKKHLSVNAIENIHRISSLKIYNIFLLKKNNESKMKSVLKKISLKREKEMRKRERKMSQTERERER